MATNRPNYRVNVPDGWHRMERFCEPRDGSKAYKSDTTGANVHVVNLYDTGAYNVNGENKDGETFDVRYHDYWDALAHARGFMLLNE